MRPFQAAGRLLRLASAAWIVTAVAWSSALRPATAAGDTTIPQRVEAVMIGDRLVGIALHLGVLPAAMSIRGDYWPFGVSLGRTAVRNLGCPTCLVAKDPDALPRALRETGIKHVLVEQSEAFDLLKPARDTMNVLPIIETSGVARDLGVDVEIVDFRHGLDFAIRQLGRSLGRAEAAEKLIEQRARDLATVRAMLPASPTGLTVVVLNGVTQIATGRAFVRVELPGGYSDGFILGPLGIANVGGGFLPVDGKGEFGFLTIRSLEPLRRLKPDALVLTGDADAVQRMLARTLRRHPDLAADVPALRTGSVFALPAYMDSDVVEYPAILRRWAAALRPRH
jgi:hypothetical protein